ncbi:hypothetical protein MKX01_027714 [Papaver californicum]|nr:hypothetical protein MKX01_027714 [Papaver californicum]
MSIELKLSRSNRIYCPNEPIDGSWWSSRSESLYGVVKPISIINKTFDIRSSGRIGSGTSEIPFSVTLRPQGHDGSEILYETFHGANISIQYLITADLVRGYLHKSLSTTMEFIVESDKANLLQAPASPEMVSFYITRDTQRHPLLPELSSGEFRVTGKICTQSSLLDPINGEVTVESSTSILVGEKIVTETSVIQTTQIADGDVCQGMSLPIYVILPRLLTCPTIFAGPFSIEFQFSVVISFRSELSKLQPKTDPRLWLAMESLPLRLF